MVPNVLVTTTAFLREVVGGIQLGQNVDQQASIAQPLQCDMRVLVAKRRREQLVELGGIGLENALRMSRDLRRLLLVGEFPCGRNLDQGRQKKMGSERLWGLCHGHGSSRRGQ